jgi:hypothetical protein
MFTMSRTSAHAYSYRFPSNKDTTNNGSSKQNEAAAATASARKLNISTVLYWMEMEFSE